MSKAARHKAILDLLEQGPVETVFADPQHAHTRALLSSVPPEEPSERWAAFTR